MVQLHAAAPDFSLTSQQQEEPIRLSALIGQAVVLYFYPKDNTSGCTLEAQQFQALLPEFESLDAIVLGVSPDSVASHCRFAEKHGLGFRLLSDPDHVVADQYGVWTEKSMYGKKFMGIQRATFLIDAEGKVAQIWSKVKADGHARQVLEALRAHLGA